MSYKGKFLAQPLFYTEQDFGGDSLVEPDYKEINQLSKKTGL